MEDQVPAINVNGKYYCPLSLRMQKSIWRHIRLRKGFVNLERLSQVRSAHILLCHVQKMKIETKMCPQKQQQHREATSSRSPPCY